MLEKIVLYHNGRNIFGQYEPFMESSIDYHIEKKHVYKAVSVVIDPWQIAAAARFEYSDGTMDIVSANEDDKENGVLEWTHVVSANSRDEPKRIPISNFRRMVYKKMGA